MRVVFRYYQKSFLIEEAMDLCCGSSEEEAQNKSLKLQGLPSNIKNKPSD